MKESDKKKICYCSSCNHTFYQDEIKRISSERYGIHIIDTVCPHCGHNHFGLVNYYNPTSIENVYKKWEIKYAVR